MMEVERIDHLVLTVRDVDATCKFYSRVLGMEVVVFDEGRRALSFGNQKINLHQADSPIAPHAVHPTAGSADVCFVANAHLDEIVAGLKEAGVTILEGPVRRTGALGPMISVYFRDPDANLIEIASYSDTST